MARESERRLPRREFLLAGAAALASTSPVARAALRGLDGIEATAALPKPERSGIQHVIVVMMENRSFDHLLGWLPGADGKQAGLRYPDRNGRENATYKLAPDYQGCGHPDPDHTSEAGRIQYNGGKCDGFLRTPYSDRYAIGYYTPADLPFLGAAAHDWTVCDRYFSAVMAETHPNRVYQHAGVAKGLYDSNETLTLPTIWDRLAQRGLTGRSYSGGEAFLSSWGHKYDSIIRSYDTFLADCRAGRLPHVAFVDPPRAGSRQGTSTDYHPFGDIRAGEHFLNKTYDAVRTSPNWRSSVLVITFDEWGGFFDHVPPPLAPDVSADLQMRGFRVPCVVISPFARRRFVSHRVFDHASILRMIEWRWKLKPLSVRDARANNLATALDLRRRNLNAPRYSVPQIVPRPCTK
ncbi:MAG: alkaline phosphatase family protein [Candidatus Dormibacteraeota bacterium]|nr:alkaline phosphatase family protein [Candidatus Dormibacteraeota bacterium]